MAQSEESLQRGMAFSPSPIGAVWRFLGILGMLVTFLWTVQPAEAKRTQEEPRKTQQLIRILGTALTPDQEPVGVVTEMMVALEQRHDDRGMEVTFHQEPGHFSITTQVAVYSAIVRTARFAHLDPDSWSVSLAALIPGKTVYGKSLSAMVGLTVIALARGDSIPTDRVITGTISSDGHIGAVEGIALKLEAAREKHLHHVLVPEEYSAADGDWSVPFLLNVSPVDTVSRAYEALTDRPFPTVIRSDME